MRHCEGCPRCWVWLARPLEFLREILKLSVTLRISWLPSTNHKARGRSLAPAPPHSPVTGTLAPLPVLCQVARMPPGTVPEGRPGAAGCLGRGATVRRGWHSGHSVMPGLELWAGGPRLCRRQPPWEGCGKEVWCPVAFPLPSAPPQGLWFYLWVSTRCLQQHSFLSPSLPPRPHQAQGPLRPPGGMGIRHPRALKLSVPRGLTTRMSHECPASRDILRGSHLCPAVSPSHS